MEYRYVMFERGSEPQIYKVPLNKTARLVNEYPDRKVTLFETLNEATAAALACMDRTQADAKPEVALFQTGPSPESEALRKRFSELTEDRVETFFS